MWQPSRPPDVVIGTAADPYLLRWYLIPRNRLFNAYYHVFKRSDDDRALHDHPWWSLSICLKGECVEVDDDGRRSIKQGRWRLRRATYRHRLELINGDCHTLFLTGPHVREWGFWICDGTRFMGWREFTHPQNSGLAREDVNRDC